MSVSRSIRVIKVGGSLLDVAGLGDRLVAWLARQPPARDVVVVGGGRFVEALRALDRLHRLGDKACHMLAIRAMSLTARLLNALVGQWALVEALDELVDRGDRPAILDPWLYLQAEDASSPEPALPHSWDVTSDSIAAQLARRLGARELVLLKSSLPPEGSTARDAAAAGYVDAHFPEAARGLGVRCVNLRQSEYPERWLAPLRG